MARVGGTVRGTTQRLAVPFEYPVLFTRGLFDPQNHALFSVLRAREPQRKHRALVVVDRGAQDAAPDLTARIEAYFRAHADHLELAGEVLVTEGGEAVKNAPEAPLQLAREIDRRKIDRQSFVVIVGGGALLDMAGYAAAIAHRGIRVVRIPTTTLSQGDSAVGVKNGVNAFGKKNYLGTFAPPWAVLNDRDFLQTQPPREARSGMSEAVKVSLIRDAKFFEWIASRTSELAAFSIEALDILVEKSALLHLAHIAGGGDPFELGTARPLDFGHWAAHKLESMTEFSMRHGEAVAIGVALDTMYSAALGKLDPKCVEPIVGTLEKLGFRLWDPALERLDVLLNGLAEFREHLGGELTITMLEDIGRGFDAHAIEAELVADCVRRLARRAEGR